VPDVVRVTNEVVGGCLARRLSSRIGAPVSGPPLTRDAGWKCLNLEWVLFGGIADPKVREMPAAARAAVVISDARAKKCFCIVSAFNGCQKDTGS